jgi:enoyl-CoA hydratase/carnithine racemase
MIEYHLENHYAILRWNQTNQPMNVLNAESIPAFAEAFQRALDDPAVRGVVVTSARREFIAGADLKMILALNDRPLEEMVSFSMDLQRLFRRMETGGKPVVAVLNGTALGGGLELCLGCHHRLALDVSGSVIGLPEVTIGLLPGGGGTQRLPRLIGLEAALPLLLEGRRLSPREAYQQGIIQQLVSTPDELLPAAFAWLEAHPDATQPWDTRDRASARIVARGTGTPPDAALLDAAERQVRRQTQGLYPAPLAILACLREGLPLDIDAGLDVESRQFATLATGSVARNIIRTSFFGLNEINKGAARPAIPPTGPPTVWLSGPAEAIRPWQEFGTERGTQWADSDATAALHLALGEEATPGTVRLVGEVRQPVVELVRTPHTTDAALARAFDWVRSLKKIPLVVTGGTYLDRLAAAYADEGQRLVAEGYAPGQVQAAARAAGLVRGPLGEVPATDDSPTQADVPVRLLYRQALEAQRCLEEGRLDRLQADVGAVFGLGYPAYTGGPISFIETEGPAYFVAECDRLAEAYGERFQPTPGLREQAAADIY